jgi:uncharacterized protein YndB with AHSA1/START domain
MVRIEKRTTIRRPIEDVFAFLTDMNQVPRWTSVKSIRPTTPGDTTVGVGKTFVQTLEFMGQQFEVTTEVVDYESPHKFGLRVHSGPFPITSHFTLTSVTEGTQVELVGEGEPAGALKLAGPLAINIAKKQLDDQLATLKKILEK